MTYDKLHIQVHDEDKVKDEDVAGINLSLKNIVKSSSQPGGYFEWVNLYGAPVSLGEGPNKAAMNQNPDLGSTFKGRVLMHYESEDTRNACAEVVDYNPDISVGNLL